MPSDNTNHKCGCCNRMITKNNVEQFRQEIDRHRSGILKRRRSHYANINSFSVMSAAALGGFRKDHTVESALKLVGLVLVAGLMSKVIYSHHITRLEGNIQTGYTTVLCKECFQKGYRLDDEGMTYTVSQIDPVD